MKKIIFTCLLVFCLSIKTNTFLKKGIILDSTLATQTPTSTISQVPLTTPTISQVPLTTSSISQVPLTSTMYPTYNYGSYYNPYMSTPIIYTQEPTTLERGTIALDTNTVSQNLPQGGTQSTGYTRYNQAYSNSVNPQYGIVTEMPAIAQVPIQTPLPTSTVVQAPVVNNNAQNELLAALSIAALTQNADAANNANNNLLLSLFGNGGASGLMSQSADGGFINANSVTTNSQSAFANTSADTGSNANTDMTNTAVGENVSGINGGYSSTESNEYLNVN